MAVDFKVEHTRTSEYLFLPQDITFKPELNGRHELPDIEGMVKSILRSGQLQPCLIRNDGGKPVLVAGFSRWRAAVEINKRSLTPVPFKLRCVYFKGSEQDGVLANISENRERNSTSPLDDGYNICRLERYGMTLEQIAEHYHEDPAWCRKRMALVSLSPESQQAVKEGKVKASATAALAKLSAEEQKRALKKAAESGKQVTPAGVKAVAGSQNGHRPLSLRAMVALASEGKPLECWPDVSPGIMRFCTALLKAS